MGDALMRINIGCGHHVLDGWVNVDATVNARAPREPEILHDLVAGPIPLPDGCADEVMAIHVLEHFFEWEAREIVLPDWFRLLRRGGTLVLEMPDLWKCACNLIAGAPDQEGMLGIYGDWSQRDPYMGHKFGWTFARLAPVLTSLGFRKVREREPEWHGKRLHRDFRVEATR